MAAALVFFMSGADPAFAKSRGGQGNPRYASIVMDAQTGMILSQSDPDKKLHPASLTKMMTLLMVFDALETGRLRLSDRITMSRHAAGMAPSKLGLKPGQTISVKDAIYALVTKSANDIAAAVAEHLGGTESQFAADMTVRASQIGMKSSRFVNASGLHDPRQITTARDMAILSRTLIRDYPGYYRYFSTQNFSYNGQNFHNHNRLMEKYDGMDGIKTGFIQPSGFNLAASAMRNGKRLVGVVLGGRTANSRNSHMADLLNQGFDRMNDIRIARADVPLPPSKPQRDVDMADSGDVSGTDSPPVSGKWASLNPAFQSGLSALIGEGDVDPDAVRRLETGRIAMAALRGEQRPAAIAPAKGIIPVSFGGVTREFAKIITPSPAAAATFNSLPPVPVATSSRAAVQLGSFSSRTGADQRLKDAISGLPPELAKGQPVIVPVRIGEEQRFRAQITGYSKSEADRACAYFEECITVAPGAY